MQLLGMLTTYSDADWLPGALKSMAYLDGGVICEGAYQETISLGKPPRSPDTTRELCQAFIAEHPGFKYIEANEASDIQQRNLSLSLIKSTYPGVDPNVLMIIDGDEEYTLEQLLEIREWSEWLATNGKYVGGLIWSKVYISDYEYILHIFPRLFLLTPDCKFVGDNLMHWPEYDWTILHSDQETDRIKTLPYSLATTHHSYQCSRERFDWKSKGRILRWGSFSWRWDESKQGVMQENIDIISRKELK